MADEVKGISPEVNPDTGLVYGQEGKAASGTEAPPDPDGTSQVGMSYEKTDGKDKPPKDKPPKPTQLPA